jgi:hypothetical protein
LNWLISGVNAFAVMYHTGATRTMAMGNSNTHITRVCHLKRDFFCGETADWDKVVDAMNCAPV